MSYFASLIGYLSTIIQFKDVAVKEALLASSDINPDGTREITYTEARNSSITGAMLKSVLNPDETDNPNTNITSFEEFQYFTGINVELPGYMFKNCSNLKYIKFPLISRSQSDSRAGIKGTDLLGGTVIEKLDLSGIEVIECPKTGNDTTGNNSTFGRIDTVTEVWIPDLKGVIGNGFTVGAVRNMEKLVVSSVAQFLAISTASQVNQKPPILPYSNDFRLYITTDNGLQKVTKIATTGITALRDHMFDNIKDLEEIDIAEPNTSVGLDCFANLDYDFVLKNYNNISTLSDGAFKNCLANNSTGGLGNVPTGATLLSNAFTGSSLRSMVSNNVTNLGGSVARGSQITQVQLNSVTSNNITSSGGFTYGCFSQCTQLLSVEMNALTSVQQSMCYGDTALTTVSMTSATTINPQAFYNCSSLATFIAPNVTIFKEACFERCTSLQTITFTIANAVEIGKSAFKGLNNTTGKMKITMPHKFPYLETIGNEAFAYCNPPQEGYVVLANTSQMVTYVAGNAYIKYHNTTFAGIKTIYVPNDLLNDYQNDTNWQAFKATDQDIQFIGYTPGGADEPA